MMATAVPPPPPPEKKESLGLQTAPSAPAVPVPVLRAQRTHPCPTCAVYEDDVKVDGIEPGMCFACGLLICGKCIPKFFATKGNKCPACKAAVAAPPAEQFAKLLDLVKVSKPDETRQCYAMDTTSTLPLSLSLPLSRARARALSLLPY